MNIMEWYKKLKRWRCFDEILCQELMIHESMCAYIQECRPEEKMTIEKLLAEIDSQGVTWDRFELQEMRKKYSMEEVDQNIKRLAEKVEVAVLMGDQVMCDLFRIFYPALHCWNYNRWRKRDDISFTLHGADVIFVVRSCSGKMMKKINNYAVPESEYDREDCRIAVLEDPEGLEKLQRMGFTHVLHIDQEEKNPDERMKILKTFRGEEAWRDI